MSHTSRPGWITWSRTASAVIRTARERDPTPTRTSTRWGPLSQNICPTVPFKTLREALPSGGRTERSMASGDRSPIVAPRGMGGAITP